MSFPSHSSIVIIIFLFLFSDYSATAVNANAVSLSDNHDKDISNHPYAGHSHKNKYNSSLESQPHSINKNITNTNSIINNNKINTKSNTNNIDASDIKNNEVIVKVKWLFIHYHKTGHDLSQKLGEIFLRKPCGSGIRLNQHPKDMSRQDISHHISTKQEDILIVAGPNAFFDWKTVFQHDENNYNNDGNDNGNDGDDNDDSNREEYRRHSKLYNLTKRKRKLSERRTIVQWRVVHFVREPYDMLMSGYLYHSQDPPPASEHWEVSEDFDPCAINKSWQPPSPKSSSSRQQQHQSAAQKTYDSVGGVKYPVPHLPVSVSVSVSTQEGFDVDLFSTELAKLQLSLPPSSSSSSVSAYNHSNNTTLPWTKTELDVLNAADTARVAAEIKSRLQDVVRLCKELYHDTYGPRINNHTQNNEHVPRSLVQQPPTKKITFSEVIRHAHTSKKGKTKVELDIFDGLRIETMRAMLSGGSGDLFRMGINAAREAAARREGYNISMKVFLSEFPVGDMRVFNQTITKVFSFLTAPVDAEAVKISLSRDDKHHHGNIFNSYGKNTNTNSSSNTNITDSDEDNSGSHSIDIVVVDTKQFWECISMPMILDKLVRTAYVPKALNPTEKYAKSIPSSSSLSRSAKVTTNTIEKSLSKSDSKSDSGNEENFTPTSSNTGRSFTAAATAATTTTTTTTNTTAAAANTTTAAAANTNTAAAAAANEGRRTSSAALHVTSNLMDSERKAWYLSRLQRDALLAPLIDIVARAVQL